MKVNTLLVAVIAIAILAVSVFRLWPINGQSFTTDAFTVTPPDKPNFYISTDNEGSFSMSAQELAQAITKVATAADRSKKIASFDDGMSQTYVVRTAVMGFPDFMSVNIKPISDTKSVIKIYSRSRFGYSDLGVNKRRVQQWLSALRGNA